MLFTAWDLSLPFLKQREHLHLWGTLTSNILGVNVCLPPWSGHKRDTRLRTKSVTTQLIQSLLASSCTATVNWLCNVFCDVHDPTQSLVSIVRGIQSPCANVFLLNPREQCLTDWQTFNNPRKTRNWLNLQSDGNSCPCRWWCILKRNMHKVRNGCAE